jgi:hypothetical protein
LKPAFSANPRFQKYRLIGSAVAVAAFASLVVPDTPGRAAQDSGAVQRAVLYDEDPSNPTGNQYVGSVTWNIEKVTTAGQEPEIGTPEIGIRADVDIPERKFKMTMSFRRNSDKSLPASHTAQLIFTLPPDFTNGGIADMPGILMKSDEESRAKPLAGLAVKVREGFFLVGLSNVDDDRQKNIQLLKERSWFDIPIVYQNKRRAILALDKGQSGGAVFAQAMAAWDQSPSTEQLPNSGSSISVAPK